MPLDPIAYSMIQKLRRQMVTRPVRSSDLSPEIGDTIAFWAAAGKAVTTWGGTSTHSFAWCFNLIVADMRIEAVQDAGKSDATKPLKSAVVGRVNNHPQDTAYGAAYNIQATTADFAIHKVLGGILTVLASEPVDLPEAYVAQTAFQAVGSNINAYRENMATPKLSATDSDIASGLFCQINESSNYVDPNLDISTRLVTPSSSIPPTVSVVDIDYVGSGVADEVRRISDPFRPHLPEDPVCVDPRERPEVEPNPRCPNDPNLRVMNARAVTWGAFEFKPREGSSVVVMVRSHNADTLRSWGLNAVKPPQQLDITSVRQMYLDYARNHTEWLAGKDDWMYQLWGLEHLELNAVADFYYGNLVEHRKHYHELKRVPDDILRQTLDMWMRRFAEKKQGVVGALRERMDKHEQKLREVVHRGW